MTRILIVDDSDTNLYLLRALLQGNGFAIDEARHGQDALDSARKNPPDLVVSDLLMPVMDGYTLLRHWRNDGPLRAIPFIVYTATYTEPRDERLAMALGADAFLLKPAEPEALVECIREVLEKRERGMLPSATERPAEDQVLLKEYNEVLIQKLEKKALQLGKANRELLDEIAERKRTEHALRESEDRYRNLFNAITDPLFVYDSESLMILAVNEAAVSHYGYSRDEFSTMSITALSGADHGASEIDQALYRTAPGASRRAGRHQTRDGNVIEVELSAHKLDFAGRAAYVVQVRDVTQIRRVEAEVSQKRRLLQAVVEGTSDAVFVKDLEGKYLLFNDSAARAVGMSVEEVLGRDDTALFSPEDARTVMENDRAVVESNEVHIVEEHLLSGGVQRVFHALKAPYRDEDGTVIGVVGVSRDITEHRKLEEQLRQSQKMEAIGRLAGGVAHDFNNLLTIISGHAELLQSTFGASETDIESLDAIGEASARAAALTRQLLGFSRKTMLQPKVLDVNIVIEETSKMLRRLIGEDIHYTTVLAPRLNLVKVDPGQLNQMIMNLVVNARDAMPKGGSLTIETRNVELSGDYADTHLDCKAGPHVMLAITDTGCGMSRDLAARIFEPFFTTKEVGKGTGLGLAMVFGIVQQSDGCIHVYSEPGRGSTFRIYLPAVDAELEEDTSFDARTDLSGSETILLVEDDEGVRGLARRCLENFGYVVVSAADGREALAIAQSTQAPLHLVLTDVVMPTMGGPELAEHLRDQFPRVKVLFTSGYTDDAVVRHGLLSANVAFIQKPYSPKELLAKVRRVLDAP
jgi:PAS domain S-box-containing protein